MALTDFRVFITGGNGFVGRHLVARLLALPEPPDVVIGALTDVPQAPAGDVRCVKIDVTDFEQVRAAIADIRPSHIVHLAAIAAPTSAQRDMTTAWKVNADGAFNVALAALHATPSPRLIHASSAEVYGLSFRSGRPVDETAPLEPGSVYGATKAASDIMIGQMCKSGLRAVRLRLFNHTGPGQDESFVVPAFAAQIARIERGLQEPVIRVGDLSAQRDFADVDDVIDAYLAAIRQFDELPPASVLNIASGRTIAIKAILDMLLSFSNVETRVETDPARLRPNEIPVASGNAALAERLLGWTPKTEFNRTLRTVLDDYRARVRAQV
jgi:GDP-4-dehydro-6-deoxy-D-mannose reductase